MASLQDKTSKVKNQLKVQKLEEMMERLTLELNNCEKGMNSIEVSSVRHQHTEVSLATEEGYETQFAYCTSEIPARRFTRKLAVEGPKINLIYRPKQKRRIEYISEKISGSSVWKWCLEPYKCPPPTACELSDVSVLMQMGPRKKSGLLNIPLIHMETVTERQNNKDCFAKMTVEVVSALSYQSCAYGMITRHQDLSMYQFKRDAKNSLIAVHEKILVFNGLRSDGKNGIGDQFQDICSYIFKALGHCVVNLNNSWKPNLKDLKAPDAWDGKASVEVCTDCWKLPSLKWLDDKMGTDSYEEALLGKADEVDAEVSSDEAYSMLELEDEDRDYVFDNSSDESIDCISVSDYADYAGYSDTSCESI